MKKQYQLTTDGKKELEEELVRLKGQRGEIADKIADARDFGDLKENADYDTARDEQSRLETRIAEIEDILLNASIIQASSTSTVQVGNTVGLEFNGKKVSYSLVGPVEADPMEGKISDESPLGVALLGKKVGDVATIETPKGKVEYKITKIS